MLRRMPTYAETYADVATLNYPASGYGLRYAYGLFEQRLVNKEQVEALIAP